MNCDELASGLSDFLDGTLSLADEREALEHLATCSSCEAVLSGTRDVIDLVNDHGRVSMSPNAKDALLASILSVVEDA